MTKQHENKTPLPSSENVITLFLTLADTTWRLFVPTILGTILGLVVDTHYNTKPLLTITGVICGTILAAYLVYRQLQGVENSK